MTTLQQVQKISLNNFKEPNSKKIIRISKALNRLTQTLTGCSLLTGSPILAGYIFLSGAVIQFILDCLPNEDNIQ